MYFRCFFVFGQVEDKVFWLNYVEVFVNGISSVYKQSWCICGVQGSYDFLVYQCIFVDFCYY